MPTQVISYGGLDITCLLMGHEWSVALGFTHRFPTDITSGKTGREARRPEDEALRHTVKLHLQLEDDEAHALRQAFATLGTAFVGIPLWNDQMLGADWDDRVYDPQAIIDLTAGTIVATGSTLNPAHLYAPLLVGHIDALPSLTAVTDGMAELDFTVFEDSPWAFRIGINGDVEPGAWPESLSPDWLSSPTDQPQQGITFAQIGEQRERAIDESEMAFRWGQDAEFALLDRDSIRTMLAFFVASEGARQPFTQPWWFKPGTATAEAPASTTARFATDSLQVNFDTDGMATVRVRVLQVPWEIEGVEGEEPIQPARIFLYRFTHAIPTPQVYRFTNWVRDLTRTADGSYAPAPMKHQEISEGIDLKTEQVTIDSFIFDGNPLAMFTPLILEGRLQLEIFEVESDPIDPDSATLRWFGSVQSAPQNGRKITATAAFLSGILDRQIPNVLVSVTCNTYLFSSRCGLLKADFQKTGTLTSVDGMVLTVETSADDAADTYAHGWVEVGDGETWEQRGIKSSAPVSGGQAFTIDWPLRQAPSGQVVVFYRGCDLTAATCTALGNFDRFRGHPNLPLVNLSLPTLAAPASPGKK